MIIRNHDLVVAEVRPSVLGWGRTSSHPLVSQESTPPSPPHFSGEEAPSSHSIDAQGFSRPKIHPFGVVRSPVKPDAKAQHEPSSTCVIAGTAALFCLQCYERRPQHIDDLIGRAASRPRALSVDGELHIIRSNLVSLCIFIADSSCCLLSPDS